MKFYLCSFFGILVVGATAFAQESSTTLDFWDVAYLQGTRAGYVHTSTQEVTEMGQTLLRATAELRLTLRRNGSVLQLGMDTGTLETLDGEVVSVFMKQYLGQNQTLHLTGRVRGNQLVLFDGNKAIKPAPWSHEVVGLHRQQSIFRDRNLRPGDRFSYLSFEPSINLVVRTTVVVRDYEEVELFGGQQRKRLLRVETTPEKVQDVQLPPLLQWLDEGLNPRRAQVEIPGLGRMILYRTTKELAQSQGSGATVADVGLNQLVPIRKRIARPFAPGVVRYRITIKGIQDAASTFSQDERQQVLNAIGQSFELRVQAPAAEAAGKNAETVFLPDEFTQSSYFINCEDVAVRQLAKKAVGGTKDLWQKTLKIEKWVHDHMSFRDHEALAPADRVARTLQGDCTEHAMLMAAMCRAEGIPSRTAVGLVYAEVRGAPNFGFHMWTEVFVNGSWVPLDATLGLGRIGATHLKIAHQSWHDTRNLTPLLPVVRVLGRISIDVLSSESGQDS